MDKCTKGIALILDEAGIVEQIVVKNEASFDIKVGDSAISVFDANNHKLFYSILSTKQDYMFGGFYTQLSNNCEGYVIVYRSVSKIVLLVLNSVDQMTKLYEEMMVVNNMQTSKIRALTKMTSEVDLQKDLFDEMMKINNELVNTKRLLDQKNEQLRMINFTDYLTKSFNRRKFFIDIKDENKKQDLVLCMMDFNNFKLVNDELGHKTGDKLLVEFSSFMNNKFESTDGFFYRLGGDEFAILLKQQDKELILDIIKDADKIAAAIHPKVSLSYGIVDVKQNSIKEDVQPEVFMHLADNQMYIMKKEFKKKNK